MMIILQFLCRTPYPVVQKDTQRHCDTIPDFIVKQREI